MYVAFHRRFFVVVAGQRRFEICAADRAGIFEHAPRQLFERNARNLGDQRRGRDPFVVLVCQWTRYDPLRGLLERERRALVRRRPVNDGLATVDLGNGAAVVAVAGESFDDGGADDDARSRR